MPPKMACGLPLPSGTLARSIQEVPASPAPQSCHLIQRESSGKHLPLTSLVLAWGNTGQSHPPHQSQAPQPPKERRALHPLRPGFIYTTTSVWVGRRDTGQPTPGQPTPGQPSPGPAQRQGRQRGGTGSSTGEGAGSTPRRTGLWLPRHYRHKQAPASGGWGRGRGHF